MTIVYNQPEQADQSWRKFNFSVAGKSRFLFPVVDVEAETLVIALNSKISTGLDGVSSRIQKSMLSVILP